MKRIAVLLILGLVALTLQAQDLRGLNYYHYDSFSGTEKVNLIRGLMLGAVLMEDVLMESGRNSEAYIVARYTPTRITLGAIHEWFVAFYKEYDWATPLSVAWVKLLRGIGGADL